MNEQKPEKIPSHVAIIMDGNRRWARQHDLKEIEGHKKSVERVREIVKASAKLGVKSVTFWAFSTENWKRNKSFLKDIFRLFRYVLNKRSDLFEEFTKSGGDVHILGDFSKFPKDIVKKINYYLQQPRPEKKVIDVNIALNYGGRDELIRTFRKIIEKGYRAQDITVDLINKFLDTSGQPDVDLMIRTGGEMRTSGFLLWQLNYAEFYFTKTYFPDFGTKELAEAVSEYAKRNRRFGGDTSK